MVKERTTMKLPFKTKGVKTNASQSQEIEFSVENAQIVADLLRKHYKQPLQTMIQEYLSNARDAHRQAKISKSIEVVMPTNALLVLFMVHFLYDTTELVSLCIPLAMLNFDFHCANLSYSSAQNLRHAAYYVLF